MPWFHILKEEVKEYQDWFQYCPSKNIHFSHQESEPLMHFEDTRFLCQNHIRRSSKFLTVELVYGHTGKFQLNILRDDLLSNFFIYRGWQNFLH